MDSTLQHSEPLSSVSKPESPETVYQLKKRRRGSKNNFARPRACRNSKRSVKREFRPVLQVSRRSLPQNWAAQISRTARIALVCARETRKESSAGCAARSGRDQAEPEGFRCTSRLLSGHSLSSMRSADNFKLLQDDLRVCGAITSSLAVRREWAAALLRPKADQTAARSPCWSSTSAWKAEAMFVDILESARMLPPVCRPVQPRLSTGWAPESNWP